MTYHRPMLLIDTNSCLGAFVDNRLTHVCCDIYCLSHSLFSDLVSIGLEFLIGSLLSSTAHRDIQNLNPFLTTADIHGLLLLVMNAIVHANRVGQLNRCLTHLRSIIDILKNLETEGVGDDEHDTSVTRAALVQKGELLAASLSTNRHYMNHSKDSYNFGRHTC